MGAEAAVAQQGFEPGEELGVAAGFADRQLVAEAAPRRACGLLRVHAIANQLCGAGFGVKLELILELAIQAFAAKHIDEA
jgi:hypothetical protein